MNRYSKQILALRDELLASVKTILKNNNMDEINVSDSSETAYVPWWSNQNQIYEGKVLLVRLKDSELSLVVDAPDFLEDVILHECDSALESPVCLNNIRDTILYALSELHDRVCHECGKPMDEGFCIDNGREYYCSEDCLHHNYTPEEWAEMYDNGNSDSYWTRWDELDNE